MATQGDRKFNYNNHPLYGKVQNHKFALAHNGIIYNDFQLQSDLNLPITKIKTDSYVAVQMLERSGYLSEKSLAETAEKINGSFVFTLLDEQNTSYFVKGDNPLALYWFTDGFYVYASTEMILDNMLALLGLEKLSHEKIESDDGDILKIDGCGKLTRSRFQPSINDNYFPIGFQSKRKNRLEITIFPRNISTSCSTMGILWRTLKICAGYPKRLK